MSWRDVARAIVDDEPETAAHDFGNNDNLALAKRDDESAADALAEREAIAIIDGGLPPSWAAALSILERSPKPQGISAVDWRTRLDAVWRRADEHGREFAACGWTFEEVFGVGESWLQLDQRGGGWLALDARIVEINPHRIVYERRSGGRSTHRRPN